MSNAIYGSFMTSWVGHLGIILLGYGTVFVPGYFLIRYFKKTKYIDKADSGPLSKLIVSCVYGHNYDKLPTESGLSRPSSPPDSSSRFKCMQLVFCFLGLQLSYLTWGLLQEKIMTKEYENQDGHKSGFRDSQFLVFVNRILAFLLSGSYLIVCHMRQQRHTAPLYKYSYCSFSNIMSSWCQYEALKFVSFPTQVLAKASKIIPTMIMGKIISGRKYEYYEYMSAVLISIGMTMFLLGSTIDEGKTSSSTTLSGVIILAGYMAFDAFTSNWQGELFKTYSMSSVQMMCGVNFFSCLFTTISLLQQGGFGLSFAFMVDFPLFMFDCMLLSVCSATGQLFIFYTISCFGPVVFVIIMTIRQGLAIMLSCFIYSHPVTLVGLFGIIIVFGAIFLRIYCNHRLKQLRKGRSSGEAAKV